MKKPGQSNTLFEGLKVWALIGTVGWQSAVPIVLLGIGGAMLDKRWHTAPVLTLLGSALALMISSALVWRTIKVVQQQIDAADRARESSRKKVR